MLKRFNKVTKCGRIASIPEEKVDMAPPGIVPTRASENWTPLVLNFLNDEGVEAQAEVKFETEAESKLEAPAQAKTESKENDDEPDDANDSDDSDSSTEIEIDYMTVIKWTARSLPPDPLLRSLQESPPPNAPRDPWKMAHDLKLDPRSDNYKEDLEKALAENEVFRNVWNNRYSHLDDDNGEPLSMAEAFGALQIGDSSADPVDHMEITPVIQEIPASATQVASALEVQVASIPEVQDASAPVMPIDDSASVIQVESEPVIRVNSAPASALESTTGQQQKLLVFGRVKKMVKAVKKKVKSLTKPLWRRG